ncbi:MAG: cupredoxin domain-containing protein [Chloroflexi bacterium]|nr:cupredoxin domain-containing protein [Chloroflexota bacterium]
MISHPSALRRAPFLAIFAALALVLAACSSGGDGGTAPSGDDSSAGGTIAVIDGAVEIGADDLAFDANVIQAAAGEAFTVTLVNNDTMPHNFSVYTEQGGEAIVVGDIIEGGATVEVEVPALDAGEYFFVCDVHPVEMTGAVVVEG